MKDFIIGYLTSVINDMESDIKAMPIYQAIYTRKVIDKLKDLLTAVEDMPEEERPKKVEPDISLIEDSLGPEELLDVVAHMKKAMSQDAKGFIITRFTKGDK